ETWKLRAEILQNMEVGTIAGDPRLGLALNPPPGDSEQGEKIQPVRVRLATIDVGEDSLGRRHAFLARPRLPTEPSSQGGEDCTVRARYYEDVPFGAGSFAVTDRALRYRFTRIDPQPVAATVPNSLVQPNASVSIEFTKPMDLDQVDNTSNLLLTNTTVAAEPFEQQIGDHKRATTPLVPLRLSDLTGDGTVLRLQPQMGFFHKNNPPTAEPY